MVRVSWDDAIAYCAWLSEKTGKQITLPSEAEWEKAARGADGQKYPWRNEPDSEKANFNDTQLGTPSAVGCSAGGVSPFGCLDMSGNVWEWCRTNYSSPEDNGLEGGIDVPRVLRGGAFLNVERYVRCALRNYNIPNFRCRFYGFRVVYVAPIIASGL